MAGIHEASTTAHAHSSTEPRPERLLQSLARLIDERVGIIGGVHPLPFPRSYHDVIYGFMAPVGRVGALHPLPIDLMTGQSVAGYGTSLDESTARIRAICEGLERYCALMRPIDGVIRSTARELGDTALDLRRLPRCSALERDRAAPDNRLLHPHSDQPMDWISGHSLTRGKKVMIPITAVYLGLPLPLAEHVLFPISTGFAAGTSYEQAIVAALCEVVERDSLALWWLHQLPFPRLDIEASANDAHNRLRECQHKSGIYTTLFDLTTDVGIPVIGVVQTSEIHAPHVVTMAACRPRAADAALRVIEEVESLRVALSHSTVPVDRQAIVGGEPHPAESFGLLYAGPDGPARFSFALRAETISRLPPDRLEASHLDGFVSILRSLDMEVIVVDVTLPEVRDVGILVVKVLVPELMPLTFSHHVRYLAHERLMSAPEKLGYGKRTEATVTSDPIPYA
jgi:ribosomal protein S12 methylthiotransferase accessory factor